MFSLQFMSQTMVFNQQCLFAGLSEAFERLGNAAMVGELGEPFYVLVRNRRGIFCCSCTVAKVQKPK
jgi:hypothetical protein